MTRRPLIAAAAAAVLLAAGPAATAHASTPDTATATFRAGSGFFLTSGGTDGLRKVNGHVTFTQSAPGAQISATGHLSGLRAATTYVTVPYKDGECLPLAGVSAFPSGSFFTNGNGEVDFSVTINPTAIVPVGVFDVEQTASVSVRQVVLSGVNGGGVVGTPTVPNVAVPEACDQDPTVTT